MKKRMLSALLTLCITLSLLPATAAAAETGNFSDNTVTWIGAQAEYQKTIDNMFVNGMRKMSAGDKWGIVDATGEWVAAPIYESIALDYLATRSILTNAPATDGSEPLEILFLDGYTQCVRGGKMGLMNQYGEEVIPCQYDAVGLPSEGICRIIKYVGKATYLGYWSLEQGRELVPPNKYVVGGSAATARGQQVVRQMLDTNSVMTGGGGSSHNQAEGSETVDYVEVTLAGGNRLAAEHDYMGGYAFVTTGPGPGGFLYGTILDKTGKEILSGGPYPYRASLYPQFGPYMMYCKQSEQPYLSDGLSLGKPLLTGVVGPQGIIIPAQYAGGIRSPITGDYVGDARMTIIPELKLVITAKDMKPGKSNGGKVGVVNFKNETVIPFVHDFNYFVYDAEHKIFMGNAPDGDRMYTATGKRLNNTDYSSIGTYNNYLTAICNGFAQARKHIDTPKGDYKVGHYDCFVNVKTGAEIFPEMPMADHSVFSTTGLAWVKNAQKKWGLMDTTGKMVIPYQYDDMVPSTWDRPKNGYAIVSMGHKQGIITTDGVQLVPFEYDQLYAPFDHGPVHPEYVEATKDGKKGLLSAITGKLVIPCSYKSIGGHDSYTYISDYFSLGANAVKTGDKEYCLVDQSGNQLPGTNLQLISAPHLGLFHTYKNGDIGAEGKVIFPETLFYVGKKKPVIDDTTLVVKDGKVGYISADKLAKPTLPKTLNPATATAKPSPTKLLVNGKSVAASAYLIGQNNYVKLRDLAYLVNGTGKNFEVKWDNGKKAINLKSNTQYTPVTGDMTPAAGGAQAASRSNSPIYVDGLGRSLTAYTINGNNYFKLRDVMRAFDIAVGYDSATSTATLDTNQSYQRTDGEKAGMIEASTEKDAPPASQVNKLEIRKMPNLEFRMTGNHTFSTEGFELRYWDEAGVPHDITDTSQMVFTVNGKVIEDGYVFTVIGMKTGTVGYKGLTKPIRFPVYQGQAETKIDKTEGQTDQKLAPGKYTMSILGKSVGMSNGWMVIDSKKPVTFGVEQDGEGYYLFVEGTTKNVYLGTDYMKGQLKYATKQKWRITHLGGDTYSVRQDDKPEMVVCSAAAAKKDGTKVMVWKNTKTPEHAIITFTPAK
ncbi:MAG: WG repeat-containing protein [Oscillospiraceae bacterium]